MSQTTRALSIPDLSSRVALEAVQLFTRARLIASKPSLAEPALDRQSLGMGIATVIAVTLAAAYVPARRAMRADPVVAMRVE